MTTAMAYTAHYEDRDPLFGSTLSNRQIELPPDTLQRELSQACLTLGESQKKKEFAEPNFLFISVSGPVSWISEAVDSLNSLLALEENWDSYGARKVSLETALSTIVLLNSVMDDRTKYPQIWKVEIWKSKLLRRRTPPPSIVPTPSGNIQLEWHRSEIDLEVEVTPSKTFFISYEDISGSTEPYEDDSPVHSVENPHPLFEYVNRIAQRTNQESLSTR